MKEQPLISVIIPVYNVAEYIEECLQSVVKQTYENLEIILVDDGSTDNSGEMCDEWKEKDQRIVVIHKENGGLSDARNAGLKIATGEYIGFIDSDDYVELSFYETLYHLCDTYHTKLASVRWDSFGECPESIPEPTKETVLLTAEEFLSNIANHEKFYISFSVWDRLYHKSIIEELVFPKGKCYEDIVYSTKAILNAGKCAYADMALYHYRSRSGSITNTEVDHAADIRLLTDRLPLQIEQMDYLEAMGYNDLVEKFKISYYPEILFYLGRNSYLEYASVLQRCAKQWKPNLMVVMDLKTDRRQKMKLMIKILFPHIVMSYIAHRKIS